MMATCNNKEQFARLHVSPGIQRVQGTLKMLTKLVQFVFTCMEVHTQSEKL